MQRNVVILDIDYVTYEDKPVIRLFSKENDKNIILIDDTFEPYLYVISDDIDDCIEEIKENIDVVRVEKVIKKDFQIEHEFLKVTFKHPQELAKNRDNLRDLESVIQIRDRDLKSLRDDYPQHGLLRRHSYGFCRFKLSDIDRLDRRSYRL